MFHNAASEEVDLFQLDDAKDSRPFLIKRLQLYIVAKVRRMG